MYLYVSASILEKVYSRNPKIEEEKKAKKCVLRAIFMIRRTYTRVGSQWTSRREGAGPRYNLTPGGYFFSVDSFSTLKSFRDPYIPYRYSIEILLSSDLL